MPGPKGALATRRRRSTARADTAALDTCAHRSHVMAARGKPCSHFPRVFPDSRGLGCKVRAADENFHAFEFYGQTATIGRLNPIITPLPVSNHMPVRDTVRLFIRNSRHHNK